MKVISPISKTILEILKYQIYDMNKDYRPIYYLKYLQVDEGVLIYNLLTDEFIIITNKEYNSLKNNELYQQNKFLHHFLVTHWFMIPENQDEKTIVYLWRNMMNNQNLLNMNFTTYTILTTTDCNARCYYCYEKGIKKRTMNHQTDKEGAKYIMNKSDNTKDISLVWFGGEPLYNYEAIDTICEELKHNNFKYRSRIISNGYLFDEKMILKSLELWNLKNVQITLDGTKDQYNKIKFYIYNDSNPFNKVIENIQRLLYHGITVSIRLHVTEKNSVDLCNLIDLLYDKFHIYKNFRIYATSLYEDNNSLSKEDNDKKRELIYTNLFKIQDYILDKFKKTITIPKSNIVRHQCMADSSSSCVISPEGNLCTCEHYIENDSYGSIYESSFDRDYQSLRTWKTILELPECGTCFYHPKCYSLLRCPGTNCNSMHIKQMDRKIEIAMKSTFFIFKQKNPDIISRLVSMNRGE